MEHCPSNTQPTISFPGLEPVHNQRHCNLTFLYKNLHTNHIIADLTTLYAVSHTVLDPPLLCDKKVSVADESYYKYSEEVIGCGEHMFLCLRDTLDILLGSPRILKNDTAYWSCRKQWLIHSKKFALSRHADECRMEDVARSPQLIFSKELDIILIPPKEGEDFDIDEVTEKEYPNINLLTGPLNTIDEYSEFWTESPFPTDNGAQRPYFYNKKGEGPCVWCLCKKPPLKQPDGTISCMKCLNHEVRKFARKSTAEQFHQQYLRNAGHIA